MYRRKNGWMNAKVKKEGCFRKEWARFISVFVIMALTVMLAAPTAVSAAELELYDYGTKKTINYTDKQIKVTLNGYDVDMKGTPGILSDGYSLVSYYDVFKTAMGLDCAYDSASGTVTIQDGTKKIVLTVGSKTAVVDGKEIAMGIAPLKIKFVEADKIKILVPSRFVAEQLGYSYTWNSAQSTVAIIKPLRLYYDGKEQPYTGATAQVRVDGQNISLGKMPGIILGGTTMLRAKKVFADSMGTGYEYDSKTKTVVLTKGDLVLTMKLGETTADLNGETIQLDRAPMSVKNLENNTSYILVPGTSAATALGYRYIWDNPNRISIIETTDKTGITGSTTPVRPTEPTDTSDPEENTSEETGGDDLYEADDEGEKNVDPDEEVPGTTAPETTEEDTSAPETTEPETTQPPSEARPSETPSPSPTPTPAPTSAPGPTPTPKPSGADYDSEGYPKITLPLISWEANEASRYAIEELRKQAGSTVEQENSGLVGSLMNVYKDYAMNSSYEKYTFAFSLPIASAEAVKTDDTIKLSISGAITGDRTYNLGGAMVNSIHTSYVQKTDQTGSFSVATEAEILLNVKDVNYSLSLSSDRMTLSLTVTANYLEKIEGGRTAEGDCLIFTGMQNFDAQIKETDSEITILLPYTVNGIGTRYDASSDFQEISYIDVSKTSDHETKIVIGKKNGSSCSVRKADNKLYLYMPSTSGDTVVGYNVRIPASGITSSMITDEDQYLNRQFVIRIAGDHTSAINTSTILDQSESVTKIAVAYSGGNTEIRFTTSSIQGYRYSLNNGYLELEVRDPDEIYDKIVVLDPGHGGKQPGASHSGYVEKDLTYKMLYTLAKDYFENSDIKAYYTRIDDSTVTLDYRASFAEQVHADFFVSLHMNAADAASAAGTGVYYSASNNTKNSVGLRSQDLATMLVNNLSAALGTKNRGIPTAKFDVIHLNSVPAVLIELAFMTNSGDLKIMTDSASQKTTAKTIFETIEQVFEKYPTGR